MQLFHCTLHTVQPKESPSCLQNLKHYLGVTKEKKLHVQNAVCILPNLVVFFTDSCTSSITIRD